jgi:prepilin-type processing-associated H-X9-DG protein
VYSNQTKSKLFWVLREAPGEDPLAEIITFVGDYQYTKEAYQQFMSSISYFNLGYYTGMVLYHDRYGKLIRALNYLKGEITNTIRCGIEGGLDPALGNRVHLDECIEILTFERDCITTYTDEGIFRECTEWILVGSRMVGNCWSTGGSGGSENYTPYKPSEEGLDCRTFAFTQTASNWQEAGVKNSRVNMLWLDGSRRGEYIAATIAAPVIIGLPLYHSPGAAANIAARACSYGEDEVSRLLKRYPTRPTDYLIDKTYREAVDRFIRKYAGTAGRVYRNMSPDVIINDAQYRLFGNGDCD